MRAGSGIDGSSSRVVEVAAAAVAVVAVVVVVVLVVVGVGKNFQDLLLEEEAQQVSREYAYSRLQPPPPLRSTCVLLQHLSSASLT